MDDVCLEAFFGPHVGMTTAFHICVGKPKSFEKSAHEVCPRTPFFATVVGKQHGQTFWPLSGSLILRSQKRAKKSARVVFLHLPQKNESAGRLAGRLSQKTWVFLHKCEMRLSCRCVLRKGLPSTPYHRRYPKNCCEIILFSLQHH